MTYDDVTSRERRISGALALVMHLLFIALLVFGVSWQKKHIESAVIVELWSNLPPLPQPKSEPAPPPPQPEPPKPLPKAEPKPPPKVEPKPAPKPDIALKEKQEKERKQKEAEKQKELEKLEARKLAEKKAREAALLKEKKEAEARLAREKEEALQRLAQQQSAAQAKIMDAYIHGVREKIRRNIVLPPNMPGNPEARFEVVQIPGGEVLSVSLRRSSGVRAYDEAVERAIYRASPLPPPPPGVQFSEVRELNLVFRPKE